MSTVEATSIINEANKLGMVLLHDPSGRKNRCFYQRLAFHLRMDVHEVIGSLEEFMLNKQFLPIKNEVAF